MGNDNANRHRNFFFSMMKIAGHSLECKPLGFKPWKNTNKKKYGTLITEVLAVTSVSYGKVGKPCQKICQILQPRIFKDQKNEIFIECKNEIFFRPLEEETMILTLKWLWEMIQFLQELLMDIYGEKKRHQLNGGEQWFAPFKRKRCISKW